MRADLHAARPARSRVLCLAEDRASEEVVVRLCIASARRSNPECPIIAYLPNASGALQHWLAVQPRVELRSKLLQGKYGWNVKPYALLAVLDDEFDEAWWIDSDVLVRRSLAAVYGAVDSRMFLASEEALSAAYEDSGRRARAWGFEAVRDFHFTLNSGVMRVSACHRALLQRWRGLLESPEYRAAQLLDWRVCPAHLVGDQDVLTALLCSAEFGDVPVRVLRRGPDIVQYYGPYCYTLRERLGNVFNGGPTFIHSQGFKPWRTSPPDSRPRFKQVYRKLLSDASTYLLEARRFRAAVADDLTWTGADTTAGSLLRILGFGNRMMTGLPLALAGDIVRIVRWLASRA